MLLSAAPFLRIYGAGAPAATVPRLAWYYDTNVTPPNKYVYHAGNWRLVQSIITVNADHIQGRSVSVTAPLVNQDLTYLTATPAWTPN